MHLPVIASTFLAFLLTRAGAYTELDEVAWPRTVGMSPVPVLEGNFTQQFTDWYLDTAILCDPFQYGLVWTSKYNINVLWTIPLEWMGSMLVFVTVLGIARTRTWVKVSVLVGLILWCHRAAGWEPATFLSGTLLAEMSFIKEAYLKTRGTPYFGEKETRSEGLSAFLYLAPRLGWSFLFIFGLYIGSHPQIGTATTPGYRTLKSLIPSTYFSNGVYIGVFYLAIGAVMILFALEKAPFLQRIFTTSIAQYLGDISFSLYMLHGFIEFTIGQWLIPKFIEVTGGWRNGSWALAAQCCLRG